MNGSTKKIATLVIVAFVLFFVLGDPHGAADTVSGLIQGLKDLGNRGVIFMQSLAD